MEASFLEKVLNTNTILPTTQNHLQKVYSTLFIGVLSAAGGVYTCIIYNIESVWIPFLVMLASLFAIRMLPDRPENGTLRFSMFLVFCFSMGIGMGPLVDMAIKIDPSILITSILSSAVIFLCLSIVAMLSPNRKFILLGGFLFSGLLVLLLISFINLFLQSQALFTIYIYLGLMIFCLYVLFNTQMIIFSHEVLHDNDVIWHAMVLFLDLINIFRFMLLIPIRNRTLNNSNSNEDDNEDEDA